jgi:hypothetical protein
MILLTAMGWPAKTEVMSGLARSILFPAALLLLAVAGCPQPKDPPVISSIDGSRSVQARDSVEYTCNASDPDFRQLSYSWSQAGGRLGWDWGKDVRWFAPDSSGRGAIRVTITDEDGLSAVDSIMVTIRAETAGVLFWDAAVKAGDFQSWSDTVRAGYKLYGYCGSDTSNTYLMVMDDTNFAKWVAGDPAVPLLQRLPYNTKDTFSVRISAFGLYHLIMDNTHGSKDCNYYLNVWKAGP